MNLGHRGKWVMVSMKWVKMGLVALGLATALGESAWAQLPNLPFGPKPAAPAPDKPSRGPAPSGTHYGGDGHHSVGVQ